MKPEDITLIVDRREQVPLRFSNLKSERGSLQTGDYSVKGLEHLWTVERKSLDDLCGSLTSGRERFERELHRMRGFQFKRLLIVGTEHDILDHNYRSKASPVSILGSLYSFEVRYDVPVVWGGTEENSALLVERWAYRFAREIDKLAKWNQ